MAGERKIEEVEKLAELFSAYPTICVANITKMPTREMQKIKKIMGEKMVAKVTKRSLVKLAIEKSDKKLEELEAHMPKQTIILFTDMEPFNFFKEVDKLRFETYAKDGDVAMSDVEVEPGPTELLPGPAISELQKVGIIAGVEGGKIAVKKKSKILKKEQIITPEIADVLRKLKIKTAQVKLNIEAIYDGDVYSKEVLSLVGIYPQKLKDVIREDLNLSISVNYPTKENIKYLISKVNQQDKALESKIGGAK